MNGSVRILAATAAAILWACESPTELQRELVVSYIADGELGPEIGTPDRVIAGDDILIEVTTYGDGCFEKGETRLQIDSGVIVISPFDYVTIQGGCPSILLSFEHEASVRSDNLPHRAVIVVQGRRRHTGDILTTEIREVVIERP